MTIIMPSPTLNVEEVNFLFDAPKPANTSIVDEFDDYLTTISNY